MRNRLSNYRDLSIKASLVALFLAALITASSFEGIPPNYLPVVRGQDTSASATIAPSTVWGPFLGTMGDVQININRTGIAARSRDSQRIPTGSDFYRERHSFYSNEH